MQQQTLTTEHRLRAITRYSLVLALLLLGGTTRRGIAQQDPSPVPAAAARVAAARQPGSLKTSPASSEKPAPVSSGQALYLVRSTLLALNDANRTNNYTVLRDLAAPAFQARNTPADLARAFTDLRSRKFDLSAAGLLDAHFSAPAVVDNNKRVRLTGFFPTRPLQINFDLTFEAIDGQWQLLAISVATPAAPKIQSQVIRPASQTSRKIFYGVRALSGIAGVRF